MILVYQPSSEWHRRCDLTLGKTYQATCNDDMVHSSDGIYYKLLNDIGTIIEVHERHFISLDKFRQSLLDKIGI